MKIGIRNEEGIVILDLDGKLDIGAGDIMLSEEVNRQLAAGEKKLLINLQRVKSMDSSGLGELIRCKEIAESQGAEIKLLHVEDRVQKVLEMARLIGIFQHYNDPIDAIASFR